MKKRLFAILLTLCLLALLFPLTASAVRTCLRRIRRRIASAEEESAIIKP